MSSSNVPRPNTLVKTHAVHSSIRAQKQKEKVVVGVPSPLNQNNGSGSRNPNQNGKNQSGQQTVGKGKGKGKQDGNTMKGDKEITKVVLGNPLMPQW